MLSKPEERRLTPRRPFGELAKILLGKGTEEHYCLVTDISEGGVQIYANNLDVPNEFVLRFPQGGPNQSGSYKVIWRLGHHIGAQFLGAV